MATPEMRCRCSFGSKLRVIKGPKHAHILALCRYTTTFNTALTPCINEFQSTVTLTHNIRSLHVNDRSDTHNKPQKFGYAV